MRTPAAANGARAPRDRPLTSLCCFAGPWSLVCLRPVALLHALRPTSGARPQCKHRSRRAPSSRRRPRASWPRVCWSGTPQPAQEVHVASLHVRDLVLLASSFVSISSSWCPGGTPSSAPALVLVVLVRPQRRVRLCSSARIRSRRTCAPQRSSRRRSPVAPRALDVDAASKPRVQAPLGRAPPMRRSCSVWTCCQRSRSRRARP